MDMDYEGAAEIERAWREGLTPDPLLTVSEWSDRHRMLSSKASAEPGRWRTSRTPYLKAIMDCLSPTSPVERVVFMKAAQLGATEMGSNWIGYVIHHAPGPMMAVWPTVEMAKRNSKQRIDPLIEESPVLAELIAPARSRDAGNTILAKEFRGGVLVMSNFGKMPNLRIADPKSCQCGEVLKGVIKLSKMMADGRQQIVGLISHRFQRGAGHMGLLTGEAQPVDQPACVRRPMRCAKAGQSRDDIDPAIVCHAARQPSRLFR